ncbi:MAG: EAL domain-containing protein [Flavobacteriaceae bacterium]
MYISPFDRSPYRKTAEAVVIEDDPDVRNALVGMMNLIGHKTVGLDPKLDLMPILIDIGPEMILLDLSLGRKDAVEILYKLADKGYAGRVILCSGRSPETLSGVKAVGERCGLNMLPPIRKPIQLRDLKNALSGPVDIASAARGSPPLPSLSEGVANGWLEVWYQPQIITGSLGVRAAEALVRLRHPQLGIIAPGQFLSNAPMDAYEAMTAFVIDSVARDTPNLVSEGRQLSISINASIRMLQQRAFLDMIRDAWPEGSLKPRLIVEVTEDELITDIEIAQEISIQLGLHDVDIAIDDFGSGFSSFAHLRTLPFKQLKLDKSYVTGSGSDPAKHAVCCAATAMARQLGMETVAEGVETALDAAAVSKARFGAAQGYYFARPRPIDDLVKWLVDWRGRQGSQGVQPSFSRSA